ncbi:MAG TPA: diguanylate cyclase [Burkholderiaceae bacterium]|jgi:diguanylate cyclase (GGDEF)-like protein/PAS domain S-box-containing protein
MPAVFSKRIRIAEWTGLVSVLLVGTGIFLVPVFQERGALVARETERLQATTQVIQQGLSRQLIATDRAISNVCDDVATWKQQQQHGGWEIAAQRLKAFAEAMPSVRSMLIIDKQGNILASGAIDGIRMPGKVNVSSSDYFQTVARHPDRYTLYVSAPFMSRAGAWTYNLARAVFTPDGEFDGLVVSTVNLVEYQLLMASARSVGDEFVAIIHGQGLQIIVEPAGMTVEGTNLAVPGTFFTRHLQSGQLSNVMRGTTSLATTTPRIVALRTIQPPELHMNHPLVVLAGRDEDTLLLPWQNMVQSRVAMLVFVWLLAVSGLIAYQRSRRRALAEIQSGARQIDQLFASKLSLLSVLDPQGRCIRLSAGWFELMGWKMEEVIGKQSLEHYTHPDDMQIIRQVQEQLNSTGIVQPTVCRIRDVQGRYHHIKGHLQVLGGRIYLDARDVTQELGDQQALHELNQQLQDSNRRLQQKEALLLHAAHTDGLTQLANRRRFDEEFQREWQHGMRTQQPLSLAIVDLDHFKQFNDYYGHLAGDTCLQEVAKAMQACMGRAHDLLARYGGEEFVVLLPNTGEANAIKVVERLRQAVAELGMVHANSPTAPYITLSVGVRTVVPGPEGSPEAMLRAADEALYQAKAQGRNRMRVAPDAAQ